MSGKKTYLRCDVDGCKGSTAESTHRVPDDAELRQTWLRLMGYGSWDTTRARMYVCRRHFTPADFTQNPDVMQSAGFQAGRIRLKKSAVPSRFLPTDPPAQPHGKGNDTLNRGSAGQTRTIHSRQAQAPVAPQLRHFRRLAPLGVPHSMLPIFLASQARDPRWRV
uniref:Protein containing THAP domain n=1 Tax=Rhipicephalus zambeziensis TaxID=60191 RepID=A0A224Z0D5_9ACAR